MKLNTLNTLIDDILLQLRNSTISESENISRIQIELWIHNYRAVVIRLEIDKGYDINNMCVSTMPVMHLDRIEDVPGHFKYIGDIALPKLILFHNKTGIVTIKDMYGNLLLLGSETKMKYQKYRKYTYNDYICWVKNDRLHVEGDSNQLEFITIDILAENPADVKECFNPDMPYPVPAHMIPIIKDMIFAKELRIMTSVITDTTNNSLDNTLNINAK